MKKKMLAVMLSATMVLTTVLTTNVSFAAANTDKFTDLSGHWGQAIINEAATLGVVGGYPEGYYLPDNLMKREEFYKLVTNVLTVVPNTSSTTLSFKDVDPIEWYVPTIKTAVAAGITKGYEDGTFGIGQMISRQEAAKVVASVISTSNLDTSKSASTAKDAALIGDWALPYVNIMFQKGYMQGDNEGNFRPTTALTRAEAATLLLNVKKKEAVIKGPGTTTVQTPATTASAVTVGDAGCQKTHAIKDGAFTLGTGTSKDPYQISTEAQLNHIRAHISEGSYFVLTKDIKVSSDFATTTKDAGSRDADWSSGNFEPIGDKTTPFKGHLDGDNHTISGLNITGTVKLSGESNRTEASYAGLIGLLDTNGSVEKLTIESSNIVGSQYTGGFVGYNEGEVTNCTLDSNSVVKGANSTGGILGYTTQPVESNVNRGEVQGTGSETGGIVGSANLGEDAIQDCVNRGIVSGEEKTGGIIGYVISIDGYVNVKNCSNQGNVKGSSYNTGGIVGVIKSSSSYSVTVEDCYNEGEISGKGVNGGIVGFTDGEKCSISKCHNEARVNGGSAGGIVGNNEGRIEYCYNTGEVIGNIAAGGIAGYQETGDGYINKSYNEANVTANNNAGGIVGINEDKVSNSYNSGTIKASTAAGGISGRNKGTLQVVYNVGSISAENGAGALVGRNAGKVIQSFWLEDSCKYQFGMEDATSSPQLVKKLTENEMSGDEEIKTSSGTDYIVSVLNEYSDSKVWEESSQSRYDYPTLVNLK